MSQADLIPLDGADGWRGAVEPRYVQHAGVSHAVVHLEDGSRIYVPSGMLQRRPNGTLYLALTRAQLMNESRPISEAGTAGAEPRERPEAQPRQRQGAEELVIPVMSEELDVQTRQWETGRLRVHVGVREREEVIDQPLIREEVRVERVPINQPISEPPQVRHEGATTIIPIVEEVLVVEKRLMLKEELRITKRQFEAHEPQTVILRSEEPQIERIHADDEAGGTRSAA